jgi:hypothetical protein
VQFLPAIPTDLRNEPVHERPVQFKGPTADLADEYYHKTSSCFRILFSRLSEGQNWLQIEPCLQAEEQSSQVVSISPLPYRCRASTPSTALWAFPIDVHPVAEKGRSDIPRNLELAMLLAAKNPVNHHSYPLLTSSAQ